MSEPKPEYTLDELNKIKDETLFHKEFHIAYAELQEAEVETVRLLSKTWIEKSGENEIPEKYFYSMMLKYTPGEINNAIKITGAKVSGGYVDKYQAVKYMWGVLKGTRKNDNEINEMFKPKGTSNAS